MKRELIFPCILIVLNLCAAVMYGLDGDVRKVVYWIASAILITSVTF